MSSFRYVEPRDVVIEGVPAAGMAIRAATGRALGRLRGVIIDTTEHEAGKTPFYPHTV